MYRRLFQLKILCGLLALILVTPLCASAQTYSGHFEDTVLLQNTTGAKLTADLLFSMYLDARKLGNCLSTPTRKVTVRYEESGRYYIRFENIGSSTEIPPHGESTYGYTTEADPSTNLITQTWQGSFFDYLGVRKPSTVHIQFLDVSGGVEVRISQQGLPDSLPQNLLPASARGVSTGDLIKGGWSYNYWNILKLNLPNRCFDLKY